MGFYGWRYGFWFRVFGYGLTIERAKYHHKVFSERYSYRRPLYVFGWRFEVLKP